MQFVFGSDRSHNYKILYADSNAEALGIVKQIKIPADIDEKGVFGFKPVYGTCGSALFYKVARDPASPLDSYYIHGIYGDASDGYYSEGGGFGRDLLSLFIKSDWLSGNQDMEADAPIIKPDPELAAMLGESLYTSDSVFVSVLARIYAGDEIILCVSDRIYSPSYARRLMYRLYTFMPPALKRYCSFTAGTAETGHSRIRILPVAAAEKTDGIKIELNDPTSEGVEIDVFSDIARDIYMTGERERAEIETMFSAYNAICCGGTSEYDPEKFERFIRAYKSGDSEAARLLLDEYLLKTDDPEPEEIPTFVFARIGDEINAKLTEVENVSALFDTDGIIEKNMQALKMMYVMGGGRIAAAVAPLYGNFETVKLSARTVDKIREGIETYRIAAKQDGAAYRRSFYSAVEPYFLVLAERVERHDGYVESIRGARDSFIETMDKAPLTDRSVAIERRRFIDGCKVLLPEAEKNGSDIRDDIDEVFSECIEEHRRQNPPPAEPAPPPVKDAAELAKHLDSFLSDSYGDLSKLTRELDEACRLLDGNESAVNHLVAVFALKTAGNSTATLPAAVIDAIQQNGRVLDIALRISRGDVGTALMFAAKYADYAEVYNILGEFIHCAQELINDLGAADVNDLSRAVCRELCDRAYNAYIIPEYGYDYKELKGFARCIAASVEKTRRNVASKRMVPGFVKCSDGSRAIIAIIVIAFLIVFGACGVLLLSEMGLLGGILDKLPPL